MHQTRYCALDKCILCTVGGSYDLQPIMALSFHCFPRWNDLWDDIRALEREQEHPFHNSLGPGILPSYLAVCKNDVINRKDEVIEELTIFSNIFSPPA